MSSHGQFDPVDKNEALLAAAEELANVGCWEHDLVTGSISRSANLCRMLGVDPSNVTIPEDFFWNLVDPEHHEIVRGIIDCATANREPYEYQARFILPDGRKRIFLTRGKPIVDSNNRVIKRIGVALDVTERTESANAIRESEERYRDLVENSFALICTHDLSGRLLSLNELPARILGYRPEELVGRFIYEMLIPEKRRDFDLYLKQIEREGSAKGLLTLKTRSGQNRIWEYHNTLRTWGVPSPLVRGMAHDITELHETARKLRRSEALLTQAEQLAQVGSWELDIETQNLAWSEQFYRMLGLDPQNGPVPYGTGIGMIHPDDREEGLRDARGLRAGGQEFDNELRFLIADGTTRVFHSRAVAVVGPSGRIARIRGMSQDVTEKKIEEERLRKSEALLSQAEQIANFGSWEYDFKTRKTRLSQQLLDTYQLRSDDEWNLEAFSGRLHPEDRNHLQEIIDRSLAEAKPWECRVRYIAPEGGTRILLGRGVPIVGADGTVERAIGVVRDITKEVRAEEDLHTLLSELFHLRDEDRRRLARQLHESVGQALVALLMSMRRLYESLPGNGTPAHEFWLSSREFAGEAIREVRAISYSMHPPLLDEAGLGSALRHFAAGFSERSGIEIKVDIPHDLGRQSPEIETTIFRIVQEALTNVHRHSGSPTARIRLVCENRRLLAEVQDDGSGLRAMGPAIGQHTFGVGITAMRERVQQLSGVFEIDSSLGHGTTIRVSLPLGPDAVKERTSFLGVAGASRPFGQSADTHPSQPER
jgi:PAS domain S-box-containing protein